MKKTKILDFAILILVVVAIIVASLIVIRTKKNKETVSAMTDVVNVIEDLQQNLQSENPEEAKKQLLETTIEGYNIEGIIEIPSIGLKYPIINETNDKTMKISVTKLTGGNINEVGNYCIAGHNNLDGTMFGKVKKLQEGDIIKLTNLYGETVEYKIFDMYVIDPNDVSCTDIVEEGTREVTLITCTNGRKNRLVTKAREIL